MHYNLINLSLFTITFFYVSDPKSIIIKKIPVLSILKLSHFVEPESHTVRQILTKVKWIYVNTMVSHITF